MLARWRKRRAQGDGELLSEKTTHWWNLPPLPPPNDEAAPLDLHQAKAPSPEQRSGSDSLGAAPTQFDAIVNCMSKPENAAPPGLEAAQSKAPVSGVVSCEEGPEPLPGECRVHQQGTRVTGRHRLMWEVVGAGTDGTGVWPPESEAVERSIERIRRPAPPPVIEEPNQSALRQLDSAASNLIEQARGRLEREVHAALETCSREIDARLHAFEEGKLSLESVSEQLQGRVKEQLDVAATDLVEQTRGRLQRETAAALETFGREVGARLRVLEQEPSIAKLRAEMTTQLQEQLRQALDKGVRKSLQELEANSRKFLQRQRESAQRLLDEQLAATILESRQLLKHEAQAITVECRGRLLREIDPAVTAKPEADCEKLATKPGESVVSPVDLYHAGPPDPRQEYTQLHDAPTRLQTFLHATFRAAVWLIPVAPILAFLILSIRPVMRLRADLPAQFSEGPPGPNATQAATEERLARAYWDSAVQYVQLKYEYGTNLPDEPVPEFKAEGTAARRGNLNSDSDTRHLYWRRLRQAWVLPQTWQKAYVWDTGWMDAALRTLQRAGRRLVDGAG